MIRAMGLTAVLIFTTAHARGGDPLQTAQRAVASGEFEKAVRILDQELKRKLPPARIAELQLLRGQALAVLQQSDRAQDAFRAALVADPTATLDPLNTPPDQLDLFNVARETLEGTLSVRADRDGALVEIDGKKFGPAPLKLNLPVGEHEVRVTAGTQSKAEKVVVAANAQRSLEVQLPPEPPAPAPASASASAPAPAPAPASASEWAAPPPAAENSARQTSPPVPPLPDGEVRHTAPSSGGHAGSFALLGAGAVLMGVGGYGTWAAMGVKQRFDRQQDPTTPASVTRADAARAHWMFPASIAAAGVGLGLAVVGAVGLASGGGDAKSKSTSIAVLPTSGGGALSVAGTF